MCQIAFYCMWRKIAIPSIFVIYLLHEITYLLTFTKTEEVAFYCAQSVTVVLFLYAFYYLIQSTLISLFIK